MNVNYIFFLGGGAPLRTGNTYNPTGHPFFLLVILLPNAVSCDDFLLKHINLESKYNIVRKFGECDFLQLSRFIF